MLQLIRSVLLQRDNFCKGPSFQNMTSGLPLVRHRQSLLLMESEKMAALYFRGWPL